MGSPTGDRVATDHQRFKDLTYDGFRELARTPGLSCYQQIGFPDEYRAGYEAAIFADIVSKLPALRRSGKTVVDIGPGCSELPRLLGHLCRELGHTLVLCDSTEMLSHLPDGPNVVKVPGRYPADSQELFARFAGRADAIIVYSVIQYVFAEQSIYGFLDRTLELLSPGGGLLLGDVPNVSKRKRFFRSAAGIAHHREYTEGTGLPDVEFNVPEAGKIDDAVVFGLLARCRAAGFDAYVLPQPADLPMANRREDVLIVRP